MKGALEINRVFGAADGDVVRVKVLGEGKKLVHFELSLTDFARAVMGSSAIPVEVIAPAITGKDGTNG